MEPLKTHFCAHIWTAGLSIRVVLMCLQRAKTLTALQGGESVAALPRAMNPHAWPSKELVATRCPLISHALSNHC